jgi:nitrogen-specific signal transduction histidine kinase/CheY-like chemotaxis protein
MENPEQNPPVPQGKNLQENERRQLEEKILEKEKIFKAEKLDSLGVLAGGIAHDFNNLLSVIFGYVDLARRRITDDPKTTEYLLQALSVSKRAQALTQQLLTFAKGGVPIKKSVDMARVLKETARNTLSASNVTAVFDLPNNLWPCDADENQMGQVINNLLVNARQAMPKGGTVNISAANIAETGPSLAPEPPRLNVKISIRDHGPGIPKEILPRVFDPFFSEKQKGSGLGLATVFSIVKKHDGRIEVESEPGKGTSFIIFLPAAQTRTGFEARKAEHRVHKGHGSILFMDDEEILRKVAREMFYGMGFSVTFAVDGTQAVDLYRESIAGKRPFDAVILDLTIPGGIGGREAIEDILKVNAQVKAIASSGYSDDPVMAEPRAFGFSDTLPKPYTQTDLEAVLHRVLNAPT